MSRDAEKEPTGGIGQDATVITVPCDGCWRVVRLKVRLLHLAESAWRPFDCPHCRKPNVLRIPAEILDVIEDPPEA